MPDNRIANAVRLHLRPSKLEDQVSRNDRALELERHVRRRQELLRRPDVVQQAGQRIRLHRSRCLRVSPLGEVRPRQCGPIHEDAVAVIEGLLVELFLERGGQTARYRAREGRD